MGLALHQGFGRDLAAANAAPESAEPPSRYGERRMSWRTAGVIAAAHIVALSALAYFDAVSLHRGLPTPVMVTLVPEQIVPPPHAPPPASPKAKPPVDPIEAPPHLITTTAAPATPPLIAPPVIPAPPATAAAPSPAPVVAPPAPPAPILPPDGNAATLHNPPPAYPIESRRRHEQGVVRLRVLITANGAVKEISVARSSGFDRLDMAALEAVRRWRFQPGTQAGVPVEAIGALSIPFRLT